MNPFALITRPIKDLSNAVLMPVKAVFVVGLCWAINAMTYTGVWWVKWVALGMGIATLMAVARGFRTLLLLALAGLGGRKDLQALRPGVPGAVRRLGATQQSRRGACEAGLDCSCHSFLSARKHRHHGPGPAALSGPGPAADDDHSFAAWGAGATPSVCHCSRRRMLPIDTQCK